jgi:hypothetical protein
VFVDVYGQRIVDVDWGSCWVGEYLGRRLIWRADVTAKMLLVASLVWLLTSCGGDAPVVAPSSSRYMLMGEMIDPASGSLIINIKMSQQASESDIKTVAETLINERKDRHSKVTVRTLLDAYGNDIPYATSSLDSGQVTHQFNQAAKQKRIPTH